MFVTWRPRGEADHQGGDSPHSATSRQLISPMGIDHAVPSHTIAADHTYKHTVVPGNLQGVPPNYDNLVGINYSLPNHEFVPNATITIFFNSYDRGPIDFQIVSRWTFYL